MKQFFCFLIIFSLFFLAYAERRSKREKSSDISINLLEVINSPESSLQQKEEPVSQDTTSIQVPTDKTDEQADQVQSEAKIVKEDTQNDKKIEPNEDRPEIPKKKEKEKSFNIFKLFSKKHQENDSVSSDEPIEKSNTIQNQTSQDIEKDSIVDKEVANLDGNKSEPSQAKEKEKRFNIFKLFSKKHQESNSVTSDEPVEENKTIQDQTPQENKNDLINDKEITNHQEKVLEQNEENHKNEKFKFLKFFSKKHKSDKDSSTLVETNTKELEEIENTPKANSKSNLRQNKKGRFSFRRLFRRDNENTTLVKSSADGKSDITIKYPIDPSKIKDITVEKKKIVTFETGIIQKVGQEKDKLNKPGKYKRNNLDSGLLLPIHNGQNLETHQYPIQVLFKNGSLLMMDKFSNMYVDQVYDLQELVLKKGRLRLKTSKSSWTIRAKQFILYISPGSDLICDVTGNLITQIYCFDGKLKLISDHIHKSELVQGQWVSFGIEEPTVLDIPEETSSFLKDKFVIKKEKEYQNLLLASVDYESRKDIWPKENKTYAGIVCSYCSYAFDKNTKPWTFCPRCQKPLVSIESIGWQLQN